MKPYLKGIIAVIFATVVLVLFWWLQQPDQNIARAPDAGAAVDTAVDTAVDAGAASDGAETGATVAALPEADTKLEADVAAVSPEASVEGDIAGADTGNADTGNAEAKDVETADTETADTETTDTETTDTETTDTETADTETTDTETTDTETAEADETPDAVDSAPLGSNAQFDIVRVEPGGSTVIAGNGVPGAVMSLLVNGDPVGQTEADASGGFVLFAELGPSDAPRVLTLTETWADGTTLEAPASVILAPVPPLVIAEAAPVILNEKLVEDAPVEQAVVTDTGTDTDPGNGSVTDAAQAGVETAETAVQDSVTSAVEDVASAVTDGVEGLTDNLLDQDTVANTIIAPLAPVVDPAIEPAVEPNVSAGAPASPATGDLGDTVEVAALDPTAPVAEPVAPVAPTVLLADEDGVRVLQNAGDQPEAMENVSIDTISYDEQGEVSLAGRATGSSTVRVYLNNRRLLDTEIGEGGQWRTELPDVDTGTYTLRVDELNAAGDVVSRAETPFQRESVAAIRALDTAPKADIAPVSLITVQPGNTLWGIAREKYGEGPLFVRVFEANTDRIRNPNLIYPGQIFSLPD